MGLSNNAKRQIQQQQQQKQNGGGSSASTGTKLLNNAKPPPVDKLLIPAIVLAIAIMSYQFFSGIRAEVRMLFVCKKENIYAFNSKNHSNVAFGNHQHTSTSLFCSFIGFVAFRIFCLKID